MESYHWDLDNPAELLDLSGSYWRTCALHAAVRLDLFSPLQGEGLTAAELAERLDLSPRGLEMLLDALTALKLLCKEEGRYRSTPFADKYLNRAAPTCLGHIIAHHQQLLPNWALLEESVRSGEPVRQRISHNAAPFERESFLLGMFNLAMLLAPGIAARIDLSSCRRLLDLGGGPGTYAIEFCRRNPDLQGVLFDLPTTRPVAEKILQRYGMSERVRFVGGDFSQDPLPGSFDVIWISHVLHSEGPEACGRLLEKAVAALEPNGLLLVQEFMLQADRAAPLFPALFSLNMLLGTPDGRAYSEPELRQLLRAAGLVEIRRLPLELPNGAGILRAHKA